MGLVVTDVVSSWGPYIKQGQTVEKIHNSFIRPNSDLLKVFTTVPTENEVERSILLSRTRVAQTFKRKWSALGSLTFKPHTQPLYKHKLDDEFYPDDLEKSWLAFLAPMKNLDRKSWPFIKWYTEVYLLPQYEEDLEMNERFAGIYAAPADDTTPAAAGTAMNGVDNIIGNYIDDGYITPFASGALSATAATFVGQVEAFVKSIDQKARKFIKYVNIAKEHEDSWLAGMRTKYLGNWGQVEQSAKYKVIDTEVMVNFVEAQNGSDLMWATLEGNAIRWVKRDANRQALEIGVKDMRLIQCTTDHWEGLGFNVPQFVYCNDQFTEIE